jgi:hypothetical protein
MVNQAGFQERVSYGLANRLMKRYDSMMDYRDRIRNKQKEKTAKEVESAKGTGFHPSGDSAFSEFVTKKLDPMQRLAIKAFTKTKEEDDPRNYYQINKDLVDGTKNYHATELVDAVDALPRVGTMTVRGVEEYDGLMEHWENWTSGKWSKVHWKAFSSSTLNPGMAFDARDSITFVIKNKGIHGRYVAPASDMVTEDEVLYKPGAKFKVVGYSNSNGVPMTYGTMTSIMGNALILEEVTEDEWAAMPAEQEPPRKWSQEEIYNYVKDNAKPTDVDSLTKYKKANPF